jgi:hypothetical protein
MKMIEYEVGRILCGEMRDYLNKCKFKGMDIEFNEGSGFLARTFIIRGEPNDLAVVKDFIDAWYKGLLGA